MNAFGRADPAKPPTAAIAAFGFALLYAGFTLFVQLPILLSHPASPLAEQQAAARIGAIIGVVIECAAIVALGFGILKKKVWAAWSLFALAVLEVMVNLVQRNISNAVLPLILLALVVWTVNSLRAQANSQL
jgi:hypothetical protein